MKYTKNKFTQGALVLLFMLTVASCKKGYFYPGINSDPTQLSNPQPSFLLPPIIQYTGYEWGGDASRFSALFMNQVVGAGNQTLPYQQYNVTPSDVDNEWTFGLYGKIMNNADQLIKISAAKGQVHYEALGKILMANALGLVTDSWGDAPYSQAFQGALNLNPKYDTQQALYTSMDGLLDDAIAELAVTESTAQPGSDDFLYGGDLTKWKAFAYSLKGKFYLHLSKKDNSYYAKALAAFTNGFASSDQDALVAFPGASITTQNPWYQENSQRPGDIVFTGFFYSLMPATDPRKTGAVFGDGTGDLGDLYGGPNSSVPLMTYDELLFDKAEAAFQTGDKATASSAYNAAVAANLQRTAGGGAAYAATLTKTSGNITLTDIMTQKYISEFLNPEVWTDWRRTGIPTLTPTPGGLLNGEIPRSLLYPLGEVNLNTSTPANTTMKRRVWWDVAGTTN